MRNIMLAICVVAMSAAISAQSGGSMHDGHMEMNKKMDNMAGDMTYVGCIQAGGGTGTFVLVNASHMMQRTMEKGAGTQDAMRHDPMPPATLMLGASSVDLRKYVGQKVAVTGSSSGTAGTGAMGTGQAPTFTVKTVKTVAASCS
jgi:hypothetical protein